MKRRWVNAVLIEILILACSAAGAKAQDSGGSPTGKGPLVLAEGGSGAGGPVTVDGKAGSNVPVFTLGKPAWITLTEDSIAYPGHFVGIGTLAPAVALDVDSLNAQLILHDRSGGDAAGVRLEDSDGTGEILNLSFARSNGTGFDVATIFLATDNSLAYQSVGTAHRFKVSPSQEAMRIAETGYVGIGTPAPAHLLDVSNGATTAFCDGTNWVNASSRAGKEGIRPLAADDYQRIREWLDEIEVVWYRYRNDRDPRTRVGLIAEDVPAVLATHDRQGISTADAIGFLTAASKQIASENGRLDRENRALVQRLLELEQRMEKMERFSPAN